MKKLSLALAAVATIGLSGCGADGQSNVIDDTGSSVHVPTATYTMSDLEAVPAKTCMTYRNHGYGDVSVAASVDSVAECYNLAVHAPNGISDKVTVSDNKGIPVATMKRDGRSLVVKTLKR